MRAGYVGFWEIIRIWFPYTGLTGSFLKSVYTVRFLE